MLCTGLMPYPCIFWPSQILFSMSELNANWLKFQVRISQISVCTRELGRYFSLDYLTQSFQAACEGNDFVTLSLPYRRENQSSERSRAEPMFEPGSFFFYFLTFQYCIGFAIYQHESTTVIHVSPILNPPPSPYHPSGSSQCTSPKHPVSCIEPGLATHEKQLLLLKSFFFLNV